MNSLNPDRPDQDISLVEALDALGHAAALFCADDRLIACNRAYRAMWPEMGEMIRAGMSYADIITLAWDMKAVPRRLMDRAQWFDKAREQHRLMDIPYDRLTADGRFLRFINRAQPGGGVLALVSDVSAERAAETRSRQQARAFRDFALATADWVWETDRDHRFVEPLHSSHASTGNLSHFLGKTRWESVGVELHASHYWRAHRDTLMRHEPFRDFRYEFVLPDGTRRRNRISGVPIFDAHGAFTGYRGTGIDESPLADADNRADRAEAELRGTVAGLDQGVLLFDADHRLEVWNASFEAAFENRLEMVRGMTFAQLLDQMARSDLIAAAIGDRSGWVQRRLELERPLPDLREAEIGQRWFQIRESATANGGMVHVYSEITTLKRQQTELLIARNQLEERVQQRTRSLAAAFERVRAEIRERTETADRLRVSEQKFRTITEGSIQGVLVHQNLKPVYVNEMMCRMLRYDAPSSILEMETIAPILVPEDREMFLQRAQERQEGSDLQSRYEARYLRPDGSRFWVELFVSRIEWEGAPAVLVTAIDIEERRRAERDLVRAKDEAERANQAKSQFLAKMSHELRTPLNAIIGFSEIIQQQIFGAVGSERYLSYAADIAESGRHLLELINDLLDLSKIEAGAFGIEKETIEADTVIAECLDIVAPLAMRRKLILSPAPSRHPGMLSADRRALKQILLNVLSNAVKFNREGGSVNIESGPAEGGFAIVVADEGIGIAPADLRRVFEPFGQLDNQLVAGQKGTGLGLPIVRALMEMHGGKVDVDSTPGEGTRVTLTFPAEA